MRAARQALRAIMFFGSGLSALFVAGFVLFVAHVANYELPPRTLRAEGIVVLTGGSSRISDALALLEQRRGRRLLITGVHPAATEREIAESQRRGSDHLFRCCVDLDRRALNTVGNAEETRRWVEMKGYQSIIVVTSEYHMPRSLAELKRVLPDTRLIPYPVLSRTLHDGDPWINGELARILVAEYVKFVLSFARQRIERPSAPPDTIVVRRASAGRAA